MIPLGGLSDIFGVVKDFFGRFSSLVWVFLGIFIAFYLVEFIIDLFFKRAEAQRDDLETGEKMASKIMGSKLTGELKEFQFLAKHFGYNLPTGWRKRITEKKLNERFLELSQEYAIEPVAKTSRLRGLVEKIKTKLKKKV
jgi:hypothetical protein